MCIMDARPTWLPDMIDCNRSIENIIERLWAIFYRDFKHDPVNLNNLRVWHNRNVGAKGYDEGFWHLIEREDKTQKARYFDPRRAERLPWLRPSIDHYLDQEVRFFEHKEYTKVFAYVWLYRFDYLAVFLKRRQNFGNIYFLLSAHYIDGSRKRKQLEKKFQETVH